MSSKKWQVIQDDHRLFMVQNWFENSSAGIALEFMGGFNGLQRKNYLFLTVQLYWCSIIIENGSTCFSILFQRKNYLFFLLVGKIYYAPIGLDEQKEMKTQSSRSTVMSMSVNRMPI